MGRLELLVAASLTGPWKPIGFPGNLGNFKERPGRPRSPKKHLGDLELLRSPWEKSWGMAPKGREEQGPLGAPRKS